MDVESAEKKNTIPIEYIYIYKTGQWNFTIRNLRFKTLFNRFPYISYAYRADGSILMQQGNPFLFKDRNDWLVVHWWEREEGGGWDTEGYMFQDNDLYNFSNGNCLADCLSHCFQDNLNCLLILRKNVINHNKSAHKFRWKDKGTTNTTHTNHSDKIS